jgi:hypothetical protein
MRSAGTRRFDLAREAGRSFGTDSVRDCRELLGAPNPESRTSGFLIGSSVEDAYADTVEEAKPKAEEIAKNFLSDADLKLPAFVWKQV